MKEKKLVIILGSMGRGGAERVISHISNYFAEKGWKVYVLLLLFNKVEYPLNDNIKIIDLSGNIKSRVMRLPKWITNIREYVKIIEPDAILSFAARINIIVQIACLGLKNKIIVSERNDPYMDGRGKIVDFFTRMLYPHAYKVIFQTKRAQGYFDKYNLNNSMIIPNPISVKCMKNVDELNKIITIGRLTKQKNHEVLLRALQSVFKKYPEYKLFIYGDGELKEFLMNLSVELKIRQNIIFEGNVEDIHRRISDAKIFVLSSNYEGLSNALLEAMMMGIPCISTNCAGADEYIKSGQNGLLVNVGQEEEIRNAILYLIEHKDVRQAYGLEAQKVCNIVAKEKILNKWYDIICN